MAADQRVVVDGAGNIAVHGRAAVVINYKEATGTPGVYADLSARALFFEVSGRYRVELAAGATADVRTIILDQEQVQALPLDDDGLPFAVLDETPTDPRVPWSGLIVAYGYRTAPAGALIIPGVGVDVGGGTVIVSSDGLGNPTVIVDYTGPAGPANVLTVAATTTGAPGTDATVTISGESPAQALSFTIPRGQTGIQGDTGPAGPANVLTVAATNTGLPGSSATVTISGTPPAQALTFTVPSGIAGPTGPAGLPGAVWGTLAAGLAASTDGQAFSVLQTGGLAYDQFTRVSSSVGQWVGSGAYGSGAALQTAAMAARSPLLATQRWTAPLVDINPIDAQIIYNGAIVPSRQRPVPSRNLVNRQNFLLKPGVTPNYSGEYHRAVFTGAPGVDQNNPIRFGNALDGRSYRMRALVRSTPGAGAQTIQIGRYPSALVDVSIVEGSDTTFDQTITGSSNGQVAFGAAGAADFLIKYCPQVANVGEYLAAEPSTEVPATYGMQQAGLNNYGVMTLVNGGIQGGFVGRIPLTNDATNATLTAGTVLVAIKKDTAAANAFPAVVFAPNLGNVTIASLWMGGTGEKTIASVPGCTGVASQIGDIVGEGYVIVGGTFDGTTSQSYFEGIEIATGAGTAGVPLQMPYLNAGGGGYQDQYPWPGQSIGPWFFPNVYMTYPQYLNVVQALRDNVSVLGNPLYSRRFFAIGCGDSITVGQLATISYFNTACELQTPNLKYRNVAVSGSNIVGWAASTVKTRVLRMANQAIADGTLPIVSFLFGQNGPNDNTTSITTETAAAQEILDLGGVVILCTQTSSADTVWRPQRTAAFRAFVAADTTGRCYLCDFAASATMGADGAYTNTLYFVDGVHPTTLGQGVLRDIFSPVLITIYANHGQ